MKVVSEIERENFHQNITIPSSFLLNWHIVPFIYKNNMVHR